MRFIVKSKLTSAAIFCMIKIMELFVMKNWGKVFKPFLMASILFNLYFLDISRANLLLNSGFEQGANNPWNEQSLPTYWYKTTDGGWSAWKNTAAGVGATGNNFVNTGAWNSGQYVRWHQSVGVSAGSFYTFSVDARTEDWGISECKPNGALLIQWKNSSGTQIGSIQRYNIFNGTINTSWARYGFTAQAPANAVAASFMLEGSSCGTIMYDQTAVAQDCDFDNNSWVDMCDFGIFAEKWQTADSALDLTGDDFIDVEDLKIFAGEWLNFYEPADEGLTLAITDSTTYQQIDGFGASLTDSSAYLLYYSLTSQKRAEVLTDLFDANIGIGLSYLRQPMGTSDFRRRADYTYDEIPASSSSDYNLQHFSIAADTVYITPVLLEALAVNPDIKIMGSPWSPPKWMKTTKSFIGGSLTDSDDVYNAYANYFVKYVQAYAALGIDIYAVTLQNEPLYEPSNYPGMSMSAAEQIRLIKLVGPKFATAGIATKIFCYDHNWDNTTYPLAVLADSTARGYLAGTAFHGYSGDVSAQTTVRDAYTSKDIYYTEWSDGDWNDDGFAGVLINNSETIINVLRYWSKTFIKWNLALDQNNGPKISGGCDTCYGVVTVNTSTGAVTPRPQYYSLGQISKFVRPGAYRIASTASVGSGIKNVAFTNPDGTRVCMAINTDTSAHNLKIVWNGQYFIYTLPAESVVTFVWPNQSNASVNICITAGDASKLLLAQTPVQFHN
jgi:glucosylceramidase